MSHNIQITKRALKELRTAPRYIQEKFRAWLTAVDKIGLEQTRRSRGWHDEPLKGNRAGQRSIRLNKQWRAIYEEQENYSLIIVEVCPHEY